MKNYKVMQMAPSRWCYEFTEKNPKGEEIVFELSRVENSGGKNSLAYMWFKNGDKSEILENWWSVDVSAKDADGWRIAYNPQINPDERKLNFGWLLEGTEENREKIIAEIYRLAFEEVS